MHYPTADRMQNLSQPLTFHRKWGCFHPCGDSQQ